jgi:hypothetical protein
MAEGTRRDEAIHFNEQGDTLSATASDRFVTEGDPTRERPGSSSTRFVNSSDLRTPTARKRRGRETRNFDVSPRLGRGDHRRRAGSCAQADGTGKNQC